MITISLIMVCNFNPEEIIFSHDCKYIFEGKSFFCYGVCPVTLEILFICNFKVLAIFNKDE